MLTTLDSLITVPLFAKGTVGVCHYFGTKLAPGPSADRPSYPGGPSVRVVTVRQVHGTDILAIDRPTTTVVGKYDAIVTNQPGMVVAVETADCVPILLLDPSRGVYAAVHAGWRGAMGGIVAKTVAVMQNRFGAHRRMIRAAIGPSIGVCCYEVNGTVLTPLTRGFPYWADVVENVKGTKAHLDLRRFNRLQLEESGIRPDRIETVNLCTACQPDLFYSYRRDGARTGRMMSGIGLTAVLS